MNDQRNLILAVVASIAILVFFHFEYEVPRAERMHQLELAEHHDQAGDQISGREDAPSADISAVDSKPVVSRADALTGQTRVKIANPRLYGSLPLKGDRIDDLTFTDYFTTIQHAAHVDLLSPSGTESPYFAVFGWLPSQAGTAVPDSNTVWKVDGDANAPLTPAHPVSFSWNNGHGLVFHRDLVGRCQLHVHGRRQCDNSAAPHPWPWCPTRPSPGRDRRRRPPPAISGLKVPLACSTDTWRRSAMASW